MSPSWREVLQVDLSATEVRVRHLARGWRPRLLGQGQATMREATPEAAAQALAGVLASALGQRKCSGAVAHVLLSGDWARFALLDGAAALRGHAERRVAAAHALQRVYGQSAGQWQVCQSRAGRDTLLAAGIDLGLHEQLVAVLSAGGATLATLRPSFAWAINQCRRWLDKPSWFVAVEPGRAVVCFCDGQQLRSLRSHRLRQSLPIELPAWLEQGRLLEGLAERGTGVVVAYRGAVPVDAAQLGASTRLVDLDAVAVP